MNLLLFAALQASSSMLCAPPPKLGDVPLVGKMSDNFWVYELRKSKDSKMLARVTCLTDERPLSDILKTEDRILGRGAVDLWADIRLPERSGCNGSIGYIERNSEGGLQAAVYGRIGPVVATLRATSYSHDNRALMIATIESFRTSLLGCSGTPSG